MTASKFKKIYIKLINESRIAKYISVTTRPIPLLEILQFDILYRFDRYLYQSVVTLGTRCLYSHNVEIQSLLCHMVISIFYSF